MTRVGSQRHRKKKLFMGTGFFPGVKSGRGVMLIYYFPSSALVKKE
jgi:hypothetical protein